jgi:yeast amino acid transporter
MALGYMSSGVDTAYTVFSWLLSLVSASALINWIVICTVYLRFYYGCKVRINLPTTLLSNGTDLITT